MDRWEPYISSMARGSTYQFGIGDCYISAALAGLPFTSQLSFVAVAIALLVTANLLLGYRKSLHHVLSMSSTALTTSGTHCRSDQNGDAANTGLAPGENHMIPYGLANQYGGAYLP